MPPIIMQTDVAANLTGTVISDQAGVMTVGQSFDGGKNFDGAQTFNIVAGTGQTFSVPILAPIVRITYTNGASAQTYMRLYARAFGTRGG